MTGNQQDFFRQLVNRETNRRQILEGEIKTLLYSIEQFSIRDDATRTMQKYTNTNSNTSNIDKNKD